MFKELKAAWREILKSQSSVVDRDGVCVMVPDHVFKAFEREFNLCFVEPENDVEFQSWISDSKETKEE